MAAAIGGLVLLALYFIPSLVGILRKVPNLGSVIVVNVFLGWSFVGWVVALAMASRSGQVAGQQVNVHTIQAPNMQSIMAPESGYVTTGNAQAFPQMAPHPQQAHPQQPVPPQQPVQAQPQAPLPPQAPPPVPPAPSMPGAVPDQPTP